MFTKSKYGDKIDDFLSKIDFAATIPYRETKENESYKYAFTETDNTKRFMTNEEYYDFKAEVGKKFNELITQKWETIDKVKVGTDLQTKDAKKELSALLLGQAKNEAFKAMQIKINPNYEDAEWLKSEAKKQLDAEKRLIKIDIIGEDSQ